jgi:hypothetical protein
MALKKRCSHEGCANGAVTGGVCIRHGAKVKRCSHDGCTNQAVEGGVCVRYGAKLKRYRCSHEGCTKYAQQGGVCKKHGAKKKRCCHEGCKYPAFKGGICWRHHSAKSPTTTPPEAERPHQPFEGSNATTVGAIARGGGDVVVHNPQTHISHAICCQSPSPSLDPFAMATHDGCATFPTDDCGENNNEYEHNHDDYDDAMGAWIYSLVSQTAAKLAISKTHESELSSPLPPSSVLTRPDKTPSGTEYLGEPGRRE